METKKKKSDSKNKSTKINNQEEILEKSTLNMSVIVPLIIVILLLILLVIGATYAYFQVVTNNNSTNTKVDITAGEVGSVAITSANNNLTLDVSAIQMLQQGSDVTYYASSNGTTLTETSEVLGKISVTGAGTFKCDYNLNIVASSTGTSKNLYTNFQNMSTKSAEQIVLTITTSSGDKVYDFNTANLFTASNSYTQVFSGSVTGLKDGTDEEIKAQLKLVNKTGVIQDGIKDSNITLSLSVSSFTCEIVG